MMLSKNHRVSEQSPADSLTEVKGCICKAHPIGDENLLAKHTIHSVPLSPKRFWS